MKTKSTILAPALFLIIMLAACSSPSAPGTGAAPTAARPAVSTIPPETVSTPVSESTTAPNSETPASDSPTAEPAQARMQSGSGYSLQMFSVPPGSHPHDVAPAPDGTVWYTAQASGALGRLDPITGETHHVPLGNGSAPHGVIIGPDSAAWVTDSGLNAIVRVDPETEEVTVFSLPDGTPNVNLNTAVFDGKGELWFTGQNGYYGRLNPESGEMQIYDAPGGRGPYGIAATLNGEIYYASLAGSHIARVNVETGEAEVLQPPTAGQGARRIWSDSQGRVWVSEWNAGNAAVFDPATNEWLEWSLPGNNPQPYSIYVDENDQVWLSDFSANAIVRFDPLSETFETFTLPDPSANVRQMLGRTGEVWGAMSGADKLVVIYAP